jgi:hypothetical protein
LSSEQFDLVSSFLFFLLKAVLVFSGFSGRVSSSLAAFSCAAPACYPHAKGLGAN